MGERKRLLNVQEAADALGVTVACIRRWILQQRIASIKLGRVVRISEAEVQRVIQIGTRPAREFPGGGSARK